MIRGMDNAAAHETTYQSNKQHKHKQKHKQKQKQKPTFLPFWLLKENEREEGAHVCVAQPWHLPNWEQRQIAAGENNRTSEAI